MQQNYSKKIEPIQKATKNTASSVLDASSQSEALQRKADMANNAAQREEAPQPNNTGMPDNLKSGIESLSGFSMNDVRVHYNSSKPATVQALAYTQGTDIHVAPGQEKHLPHEAWHVAQQMAGRVSPTTNVNGMPVNDNAGLEHEADVMGEKAVQFKECGINGKSNLKKGTSQCKNVSQRCDYWNIRFNRIQGSNIGITSTVNPVGQNDLANSFPTNQVLVSNLNLTARTTNGLYPNDEQAKNAAFTKLNTFFGEIRNQSTIDIPSAGCMYTFYWDHNDIVGNTRRLPFIKLDTGHPLMPSLTMYNGRHFIQTFNNIQHYHAGFFILPANSDVHSIGFLFYVVGSHVDPNGQNVRNFQYVELLNPDHYLIKP